MVLTIDHTRQRIDSEVDLYNHSIAERAFKSLGLLISWSLGLLGLCFRKRFPPNSISFLVQPNRSILSSPSKFVRSSIALIALILVFSSYCIVCLPTISSSSVFGGRKSDGRLSPANHISAKSVPRRTGKMLHCPVSLCLVSCFPPPSSFDRCSLLPLTLVHLFIYFSPYIFSFFFFLFFLPTARGRSLVKLPAR
jgi:hypothetical protein